MKKGFLFFAIGLMIACSTQSQTVYNLKYHLSEADTTTYDAFVVITGVSGSFARVNFWSPEANRITTVEVQLEATFSTNADGETDESSIGYIAQNPKVIRGNRAAVFNAVVFWFKQRENEEMQPMGVAMPNSNFNEVPKPFTTATMVKQNDLKRNFLLQYFTTKDSVYQRMFEGAARGPGSNISDITTHIIIVANVNDTSIGPSAAKDKDEMLKMLNNLAGIMKVNTNPIIISGSNYGKPALVNELAKFKPNKQDIVIFYYSGHGFRKSNTPLANLPKDAIFPHLDLRANYKQDYMKESLGIDSVYRTILAKGARFNLVIGDCCNAAVGATNTVSPPPGVPRGPELQKNMRNIETLFLSNTPTSILATAANVQELASSNNSFGGFFTYFFRAALNAYLSPLQPNTPTWEALLRDAQTETAKKARRTYCDTPRIPSNICRQTPIYSLLGK